MKIRRIPAVAGAVMALGLLTAASALAAGPAVSVRVEGLKRTLLATTTVHAGTGSVTKGRTPAGVCPAASAAGALDAAARHRWDGSYSSGLGIEVTTILGETHRYSPNGYYWGIWVDNTFASAGICDLKLHKGEHLLFAPAPAKGTVYPTAITAPSHATTGTAFTVTVVSYTAKGKARPLSGAVLDGARTNAQGVATITPTKTGRLRLTASRTGYIRSAAVTVTVTG
jgi:hypothetical protein